MNMTSPTRTPLSSGWTVKRTGEDDNGAWLSVEKVPTEIHLDLLANKNIADPFQNLNELSTRWAAELSWTYRTTFHLPAKVSPDSKTDLVFEGLDTFATVLLNGKEVLKSNNAFIAHRLGLYDLVDASSDTDIELQIIFESARKKGLELVKEHPEHRFIVHQTEVSRGPVRKAQYHWGWDWGPILISCGPWKPIFLESYSTKIKDSGIAYKVSEDLKRVQISAFAFTLGSPPVSIKFALTSPEGDSIMDIPGTSSDGSNFKADYELIFPRLWWPRGYGYQSRYKLKTTLLDEEGEILDEGTKLIGFRRAELIQEKDSFGTSFYFRINNVDIFAGGSCWIPADSFVSRITDDRYRDWVRLVAEGNQVMLRVWGGGIYEPDVFYDTCDEFGVLVWQDFMFACASYPTYPEYLASVEEEARQNVQRLRGHPSIIIWAGNNEDYQLVERYELEYPFEEDKDPQSWLKSTFPARFIYEDLLPKILKEEDPGTIYHPSSPCGDGTSTVLKVDPTVGDIHQWNIWHGEMKPYQNLPDMGGRFVSEFGMEAYPHLETIKASVTEPAQQYPGSMTMDFHNKATGHERRMLTYVAENFQVKQDLPSFTHLTQIVQSDAMSWAYKSWRRQWGRPGSRRCGGALVWQLNDCWPTMSWAVVDYFLVPKPAYYAIKRALAPITVGVSRKIYDWTQRPADALWQRDTGHADPTRVLTEIMFDVWVSSVERNPIQGLLSVRFVSIRTGELVRKTIERKITISPNGTTDVVQNKLVPITPQDPVKPFEINAADPFVIHVTLAIGDREVATDTSWPDPIKYLNFQDRGVMLVKSEDQKILTVTAEKPVKGFVFSEKRGIKLGDNGFDIMPNEKKKVVIDGPLLDELSWTYVGQ